MLHPPQLITNARMLYMVWHPRDPDVVAGLVPAGLTPNDGRTVFLNQYVVDDASQVSDADSPDAFGAYSLTYIGVELAGLDTEAGVPGRYWTHYFNSSENMVRYAKVHGLPATSGRTTLELENGTAVATTYLDGRETIRTIARVEVGTPTRVTGQLRYLAQRESELRSGRYPYVADLAETFEVESVEFLDPSHAVHELRPAEPLSITFGFYSPSISFCYAGGEGPLGSDHGS